MATPTPTAGPLEVSTPDSRTIEVLTFGAADGFPLVYHSGSPSAAVEFPLLHEVAERLGLRVVTWSRPGYGGSSPRTTESAPRMADDVSDTVTVLAHLGLTEFVTLGCSGGGPRALACAALLPHRCRAAASLAGVAPHDLMGAAWTTGMGTENVAEYAAASAGPAAYAEYLTAEFLPILDLSAAELADAMGGLVTPVDAATLTGPIGDYVAASFQRAAAQGVVGVRDDGLAAVAPWGVDLASITVPVSIWQGGQDAMVPAGHGEWLAAHVPGVRAHLLDDEGHLSLVLRLEEILAELKSLGGVG